MGRPRALVNYLAKEAGLLEKEETSVSYGWPVKDNKELHFSNIEELMISSERLTKIKKVNKNIQRNEDLNEQYCIQKGTKSFFL